MEGHDPSRDGPRTDDARLVPPPRVRPIQPVKPEARAAGAVRRVSWLPLALVAGLSAVAVATFLLLPRLAGPAPAGVASVPPAPPAPPSPSAGAALASPEELRERAYLKGRAEEAREAARALEQALVAREAALWAGDDLPAIAARLAGGDQRLVAGRFDEADADFRAALEALRAVDARSMDVLRDLLDDGREALQDGDSVAAAAAFRLAGKLAPGNAAAAAGLRRAEVLDEVLEHLRAGRRREAAGDLAGAEREFAGAASLDPMSREALEALARVQARAHEDAFAAVMSEGLAALEASDWAAAREALGRAGAMRPGSPQVAEALAQVDEAEKLEAIVSHRARASEREAGEDWAAAAADYEAVLAIDPALAFAQEGRARAAGRAGLAARLDGHIARPDRLSSDAVLAEALDLLVEARDADPAGPRHRRQVADLEAIVAVARKPVRVTLESDGRTDVTVHQVGRLGRFDRKDLDLRPGAYTVVGTRDGYRDVRRVLVVDPAREPQPLVVRCEERI